MTDQDDDDTGATLVPVDRHELTTLEQQWADSLQAYKEVPCESPLALETWVTWRNHAHEAIKEHESTRLEVTGPLNKDIRRINKWFKAGTASLRAFKELANERIEAYELKLDREAAAKRLEATQAAAAGDHEAVYDALAAVPDQTKTAGNSVRMVWSAQVDDVSQLPAQWTRTVANEETIVEYLKMHEDKDFIPPVPGLSFVRVAKARPVGRRK